MLLIGTKNIGTQTVLADGVVNIGSTYRKFCKRNRCGVPTFGVTANGVTLNTEGIYHITAVFVGSGSGGRGFDRSTSPLTAFLWTARFHRPSPRLTPKSALGLSTTMPRLTPIAFSAWQAPMHRPFPLWTQAMPLMRPFTSVVVNIDKVV